MTMKRLCAILTVTCAAALFAACGGSGDKPPPGSEGNPLPALPNPTGTKTPPTQPIGEPSNRARSRSNAGDAPAGHPGTSLAPKPSGRASDSKRHASATARSGAGRSAASARRGEGYQKALAPSSVRPCSLVTKGQARAILGTPIVEPLQAPQGPTCIYESRSGKQFVTLAVQTVSFAKLKRQLRSSRSVQVAGSVGYCGSYGRPMLYLPLSSRRVLSVAASCDVATRFAAKAAPRL